MPGFDIDSLLEEDEAVKGKAVPYRFGKGLGDSGGCQKNVNCYPSWNNEAGGVALVLKESGADLCSGCLLNYYGQDYKGIFLTAFHCVDTYRPVGELSQQEKENAEEWMFKFNYRKTSCYGSELATSTIYQDCDFKAAWRNSDFALVELDDNLDNNMCLSFLGWDRRSNVPTEGIMIHHPSGDVMKISFDDDQLVETDEWDDSGDGFWKVDWDIGAAENISSGAPLFDQNKRVVGQLLGGESECYGDDMRDWFGCFYHSWTGGGNDTTRLSNHLGNAYYMNTIRPGGIVTGPDIVCTDEETFTFTNAPPGSSVSWTASYVTPSSGEGITAEFESTCPSAVAIGSVIFTISNLCGGTGNKTANKTFASGGPHPSDVELYVTYSTGEPAPTGQGSYLLCPYTYYYFYVINTSNCSTSGYDWTLPPSITEIYKYNNMICVYTGSNPGENVLVYANTCCGCEDKVRILSDYVGTYWDCDGYYFSMSPNPADDYVEIIAEKEKHESTEKLENEEYEVRIYNNLKILMYQTKTKELQFRIDTRQFQSGVYFVHFIIGDDTEILQLIVNH